MLTSPITTPHFRTSVINLVATYYDTVDSLSSPEALPVPLVPALKPIDSTLIPSDSISQLLIMTASWVDLASSDPVIASISQQVFNLEVAYAAFCGVQHVVVHGPTLDDGSRLTQFSRAMQEAISIGPYIQFHVLLPISTLKSKNAQNNNHLAHYARHSSKANGGTLSDWSSWEVWNAIRQFCNYAGRISVGKAFNRVLYLFFSLTSHIEHCGT
jgi:protein arginine N-methyltransferase 5